jgi:acetyl-CoA carboxylase biotin carboxyl carrier protein
MSGLSREDIAEILRLVDASGYGELRLEVGDLKLYVRKDQDGGPPSLGTAARTAPAEPARGPAPEPPAEPPSQGAADAIPEGMVAIRAPTLGAFYRAPAPGEPPFVEVGDTVEPTQDVGLIEVMKLFNAVQAGVAGRVVEIRPENGAMVEYGEVLMLVEPAPGS